MQWDVFCRVIDNFGDIGVCWRLCADLAARGHQVRLWVDDGSALQWMAPGALQGDHPGLQVLAWEQSLAPQMLETLTPSDVWVEGFGCEIAPEFIAAHPHSTAHGGLNGAKIPAWINLEYLTAESFAERSHGLPSPILHGPARGWTRHFFYPGFSTRTGGLLREHDLTERLSAFNATTWLHQRGVERKTDERLVALFCYEPPALRALLAQWAASAEPTRLLVTAGRASTAVQAAIAQQNSLEPSWNKRKALSISYIPQLSQYDFDHLLWACDLNFVRGEDSLVRALWAGKPLVWQIYPQDDAAHHAKLEAFLDMLAADPSLRRLHRVWNGMEPGSALDLPTLTHLKTWSETLRSAHDRLLQHPDLATQMLSFVQKKR